jgi:cell surface protein SprA
MIYYSKIEVGNVSMPLNSSLIRGAQSLFGVKLTAVWKTTVTGVFSEQNHKQKCGISGWRYDTGF